MPPAGLAVTGPDNPVVRRVALVTGAARGIGAATVRALCGQGYGVVAVDSCDPTGPDELGYDLASRDQLAALAEAYPAQVSPVVADVRDRAALAGAAATAVERFGRLDAAVAGAAVIAGGQPLWETPEAQLRRLLDVDLVGVWNTAAACVPLMLAGPAPGGCRFVGVASSAGTHGLFGLAAYNAAKHGVIGLVRGLAEDLVGTGVTAVAVAPGSTRTDMLTATARLYHLADVAEFTTFGPDPPAARTGRGGRHHRLLLLARSGRAQRFRGQRRRRLPAVRFTPDRWLRRWDGRRLLAGGSPWQLVRVNGAASSIVDEAIRPELSTSDRWTAGPATPWSTGASCTPDRSRARDPTT